MRKPPPTRLKLIRQARGLTQAQLARFAGVNYQYLAMCEAGAASGPALAKIAAYLGVTDPASLVERITNLEQLVTEGAAACAAAKE